MINRIFKPVVYILDADANHTDRLAAIVRDEDMDVRVYDSVEYFLNDVSPKGPACVVLEMELPRSDGLEVQRQLNQRGIGLPVLFFARRPSIAQCVAAIDAGAVGFIEKPAPAERLLKAIGEALDGHADQQARLAARADVLQRIETLTVREGETLQMLLEGLSVKQISKAFKVGGQTIAKHRARGLAKMNVRNDALLVRLCLSHGIRKLADIRVNESQTEKEETAHMPAGISHMTWTAAPALALVDQC